MKSPKPYIELICIALDRIRAYKPKNRMEFLESLVVQDAVMMRLQEIGENLIKIRTITPDFFDSNERDDWHKLIGLRNIISHSYHDIDAETIWEILDNHLPQFEEHIRKLR